MTKPEPTPQDALASASSAAAAAAAIVKQEEEEEEERDNVENDWLQPVSGQVIAHTFRIPPKEPLMESLKKAADFACLYHGSGDNNDVTKSAFILTAVGSLSSASIRLANHDSNSSSKSTPPESNSTSLDLDSITTSSSPSSNDIIHLNNQRFEIVSLVGTFAPHINKCHLHISLSDKDGHTIGGHLIDGIIFTTLELVIGTISNVEYTRKLDHQTGFLELVPKQILNEEENEECFNFHSCKTILLFATGLSLGALGYSSFLRRRF